MVNYVMAGMLESLADTLLEMQQEMKTIKAIKMVKMDDPVTPGKPTHRQEAMSTPKKVASTEVTEEDPNQWYGLAHGKGGRSGVYPSWAEVAPLMVGVSGALV